MKLSKTGSISAGFSDSLKMIAKANFDPKIPHPTWQQRMGKPGRPSFGGVVMRNDASGNIEVLMRIPTNNYGKYSWTFAKGGVEPHLKNDPHAAYKTAINEVQDEMGIENPNIIGHIPLTNENSAGVTGWSGWYLMQGEQNSKPRVNPELGYPETSETRWMSIDEAKKGIAETLEKFNNVEGYNRDMAVLNDAVTHYKQWMDNNA